MSKQKKELSELEIRFISEQSGMEFDVVKSWYKEFLQQCPNGKMNKKNFYKFYKLLRGQTTDNLAKIADRVFSCFDKDSSGFLDFSEDTDKDGFINDVEFLKVIEAMYEFKGKSKKEYPPEKCVRDIFRRIDENGDKKLTESEFIEGCLANKNIMELISPFEI